MVPLIRLLRPQVDSLWQAFSTDSQLHVLPFHPELACAILPLVMLFQKVLAHEAFATVLAAMFFELIICRIFRTSISAWLKMILLALPHRMALFLQCSKLIAFLNSD